MAATRDAGVATPPETAPAPAEPRSAAGRGWRRRVPERTGRWVPLGLALLFLAFVALTWKTWGNPQADYGVELTAADRLSHGAVLYDGVRYFYGPLGVYPLAAAFAAFGASFTTAFGFGLAVAAAIFASFYALARAFLSPVFAGAATAVVVAIGFTGSLFGYVAPHTTSATFGLLAILLQLLALTRGRLGLAGIATGAALLTRPELGAVALAVVAGFLAGRLLDGARRAVPRELALLLVPALLLPLLVFGPFALAVGPHDLLFEQLIPLDMLRIAGLRQQHGWAPFDFVSAVSFALRGIVYAVLVAALATTCSLFARGRGPRSLLPLVLAVGGLLLLDGAAHVLGAFPGTIGVVQTEAKRFLLGMSWLPFAVAVTAVWLAIRWRQLRPPPLSGRWSVDLALLAGCAALALRAYDDFTTDTYAAYYAPPLVLLATVAMERAAARLDGARAGVLIALAATFATLAWAALERGPARDDSFEVRTARGTYLAPADNGPHYQRMLDLVRARTRPGEPVLGLPLEGGLPFAADRPPALRELQVLPGVIDSHADERQALSTLTRDRVPLVVLGNARFDAWGLPVIGVDFDRLLLAGIERRYRLVATFGDWSDSPEGAVFARAFRVYARRGATGGARARRTSVSRPTRP